MFPFLYHVLERFVFHVTMIRTYSLQVLHKLFFSIIYLIDHLKTSYPDDEFHRMWQQFKDSNPIVKCQSNVTPSDFWNMPPSKALNSAITASRGRSLQIQWPPMPLYGNNYHISLYFQDNRTPSPYSWRVFNVLINGDTFYSKLNVTTTGVNVYSNQWPFNGQTQIKLVPDNGTPVGPVINAAEMFQLIPLGGKTTSRDGNYLVPTFLDSTVIVVEYCFHTARVICSN